jgi:hypothetical protein
MLGHDSEPDLFVGLKTRCAAQHWGVFTKKSFWPFGAWRCTPLPSESMATVCQHGARSGCFNGASLDPIGESTWQIIDDQLHSIGELV